MGILFNTFCTLKQCLFLVVRFIISRDKEVNCSQFCHIYISQFIFSAEANERYCLTLESLQIQIEAKSMENILS